MNRRPRGSSAKPRVLLRLDADHEIGLGHAVRCQALLARLPALALDGIGRGAALARLLPCVRTWASPADGQRALAERAPDLLLVDHPEPEPGLLAAALREGTRVVRIDDFGFDGRCDLVINGAPGATDSLYPGIAASQTLCGPAFSLLREAFAAQHRDPAAARPHIVAVVGSGASALPFARCLAGALAGAAPGPAGRDLVVGAAFPDDPVLTTACRDAGVELHRGLAAGPLAALLARASLAVTTGGMIVSECLTVGVPLLAFAQVASTAGELEWLELQGALARLPERVALDPRALAAEIASRLADPALLERARRGRRLFDGRGAGRVADAIDALLPAQGIDAEVSACALP